MQGDVMYKIHTNSEEGNRAMMYFSQILGKYVAERPAIPIKNNEIMELLKCHLRADYMVGYLKFDNENDYNWFLLRFG